MTVKKRSTPVIIAQFSDLHVMAGGQQNRHGIDPAPGLAACIASLHAQPVAPDLLVSAKSLAAGLPLSAVTEVVRWLKDACADRRIPFPAFYLADTMGWANPEEIKRRVGAVREIVPQARIGLHLHDTRGLGASLEGRDNVISLHTCGKALGVMGALVLRSAGQPLAADRLDDEIARARAHRLDHVLDPGVGRDHDDRQPGPQRPDLLQDTQPVDLGHLQVEQHQVEIAFRPLLDQLDGRLGALGLDRPEPGAGDDLAVQPPLHRVVIDDQNGLGHAGRSMP